MLKVFSPYDQSLIQELPWTSEDQLEKAISIAHSLFSDSENWLAPHQRIKILENVVELFKIKRQELVELATREGGKPVMDTEVEMERAINGVKLAINGISNLAGKQIPMGLTASSENRVAFTAKEPIGVVAAISAFNHPINLIVHQAITAVAAGCPVIVKPALTTPLTCIAIAEILVLAGLPKAWCQVVVCEDVLAEKLATDKRINFLSFIGSSKVGWHLRSKLSPGTRCALEHGGSAPVIVAEDADSTTLLPALIKGGFYHAGQVCVSVQRVFVHENQARELAQSLGEMASHLKVGNPLEASTEIGPLILPAQLDRVEMWVKEAVQEGAEIIYGGKRLSDTMFEPTVLLNPPLSAKVSCLEVFGPVMCIYSTNTTEEAIEIANSIDTHFQASVFTKDIDKALYVSKKLNAAAVMVNDHTAFRVDWMPFGGRDSSGLGVGGIEQTMLDLTRDKLTVIKSNKL